MNRKCRFIELQLLRESAAPFNHDKYERRLLDSDFFLASSYVDNPEDEECSRQVFAHAIHRIFCVSEVV